MQKDYPESCLPAQFKKPSGAKAKQLLFEQIEPEMYKPHARMVALRIRRERLEPWIWALMILFYEHFGKANSFKGQMTRFFVR